MNSPAVGPHEGPSRATRCHVGTNPFFSDYGNSIRVLGEARALQATGAKVLVCSYRVGADLLALEVKRVPFNRKGLKPGFSFHRIYLDIQLTALALSKVMEEPTSIPRADAMTPSPAHEVMMEKPEVPEVQEVAIIENYAATRFFPQNFVVLKDIPVKFYLTRLHRTERQTDIRLNP